jgi:hypothetical protein
MPYNIVRPITDALIQVYNPAAGTPAGSAITANSPFKGQVIEAGFVPNDSVTSATTLAVLIGNNQASTIGSSFANIITSTLGTFSSVSLFMGQCASVAPPSPSFVNAGDAIRWVTSGGNTSAVGATLYAVIRRAV